MTYIAVCSFRISEFTKSNIAKCTIYPGHNAPHLRRRLTQKRSLLQRSLEHRGDEIKQCLTFTRTNEQQTLSSFYLRTGAGSPSRRRWRCWTWWPFPAQWTCGKPCRTVAAPRIHLWSRSKSSCSKERQFKNPGPKYTWKHFVLTTICMCSGVETGKGRFKSGINHWFSAHGKLSLNFLKEAWPLSGQSSTELLFVSKQEQGFLNLSGFVRDMPGAWKTVLRRFSANLSDQNFVQLLRDFGSQQ